MTKTELVGEFWTTNSSGVDTDADALPTGMLTINTNGSSVVPSVQKVVGAGHYKWAALVEVDAGDNVKLRFTAEVSAAPWSETVDVAITPNISEERLAKLDRDIAAAGDEMALTTAAEASAATTLLAAGDADGYTVEQSLKLMLAVLAGKVSGGDGLEVIIRAADDSKARVTATVDIHGNRSALVLDAT